MIRSVVDLNCFLGFYCGLEVVIICLCGIFKILVYG